MPVIPVLWRLRQKECQFEATLDCIVRPCLELPSPQYSDLFPRVLVSDSFFNDAKINCKLGLV
jgi:hypothetical protein